MKEYRICITYLATVEAENEQEALKEALKEIENYPDIYNDVEIEEVEGK